MNWGREVDSGGDGDGVPVNQDRARLVYATNLVLARQQLPLLVSASRLLLTVPQGVTYIMKSFVFFNTDAGAHTATLRIVAAGTVDGVTSDYWEDSIPARRQGGELLIEEVLPPGWQIVAYADTADVINVKINGAVLSQQ